MSNSLKEVPQIKELMVKGRNVGYLMAEEIGKSLPPELATSENMEELIGIFEFMEIAIVDSEKEGLPIPYLTIHWILRLMMISI